MAIYDENGVPLLNLGASSRDRVAAAHEKAVRAWERNDGKTIKELLVGTHVFLGNPAPVGNPDTPGVTQVRIGGASLDEALKDVVGAFDGGRPMGGHVAENDRVNPPLWVASTDPGLAELLSEHYRGVPVRDASEVVVYSPPPLSATRVAVGRDIESAASFAWTTGFSGTATTAPTATTFTTDGVNIPVNSVVGQLVVTTSGATRVGIIQSNTSAASSVLTIDRWYNVASLPANRGVAAASTPTAGLWLIVPGNAAAAYIGLTANATAAGDGDTTLTSEITTVGGGLIRTLPTYAHTAAGTTSTLTNTWTANGTDSLPVAVAKIGVFQGVEAASRLFFETIITPATATLSASGDQLQITETITL